MAKKQKDEEKAPDGDLRNNQVRVLTCKCCLVTGYTCTRVGMLFPW